MGEEDRHARRYRIDAPWRPRPKRSCVPTSRWSAPAPRGCSPRWWRRTQGASVALVSRSPLAETASFWAQGGIAAALGEGDSPELHVADTLAAGRGAARESAVRVLCEESPARVHELEALGVTFDADRHGNLALGLEGGHSRAPDRARRRVRHRSAASPASCPPGRRCTSGSRCSSRAAGVALWTLDGRCIGLLARRRDGAELPVLARATVLATGGMAALWERTTNPPGPIGAGLGLAEAAGAPAGRPRVHPVPPHRAAHRRRARRLPHHRGGARRGSQAARRRGRALRGRAGAARPRGARDRGRAGAAAASGPSGST